MATMKPPRQPSDVIFGGVVVAVFGAVAFLFVPVVAVVLWAVAGCVLQVGLIGAGVRIGMYWTRSDQINGR